MDEAKRKAHNERNKRYRERLKETNKTKDRKKEDILCPDCNIIRQARSDVKRKTNRCNICSIKYIRKKNGDILHNLSTHPLYIRWLGMRRRVIDPLKANSYLNKGIIVCDEWNNNFLPFYEWSLKNGFKEDLEIDRINNNGNYCPENCRWISHKENCQNK
jgi:hypothetical protein